MSSLHVHCRRGLKAQSCESFLKAVLLELLHPCHFAMRAHMSISLISVLSHVKTTSETRNLKLYSAPNYSRPAVGTLLTGSWVGSRSGSGRRRAIADPARTPRCRAAGALAALGPRLAGASAASTLAELGYRVEAFSYHDSPRRAHSVAAQGGINAAKNYQNDGDSTNRLFYDTIKGGDFRSREANVYRLAEVSANIIDQAVAQGVPFAREYGGTLANRTVGGVLVSRTFPNYECNIRSERHTKVEGVDALEASNQGSCYPTHFLSEHS